MTHPRGKPLTSTESKRFNKVLRLCLMETKKLIFQNIMASSGDILMDWMIQVNWCLNSSTTRIQNECKQSSGKAPCIGGGMCRLSETKHACHTSPGGMT